MSESKSTSISLDVYSARRSNCQVVYPYRIVRPLGKNSRGDQKKQLSIFLDDILKNTDETIEQYIADNLKRATGRDCLNHASTWPCEYCYSKGVRCPNTAADCAQRNLILLREKFEALQNDANSEENLEMISKQLKKIEKQLSANKRSHIVWPSSTFDGESRTTENMLEIVREIEARGKIPVEEAKGVVGRSPLFLIPNFDFVMNVPCEYLHSGCIGVVKKMIVLTFKVGETKKRVTKRKLTPPSLFNKFMREVNSGESLQEEYESLILGL